MEKLKYQEAEIKIITILKGDIVFASNISNDDELVELPFVPAK